VAEDNTAGPNPLTLRPARPADAAAVAGIHVRSWQGAYRGLMPDDYLDALRPEDRMARYDFAAIDPWAPATVVALEGGIIRGFATTGRDRSGSDTETGELMALYVDPPAWGTGIGRRLIAAARQRLTEAGCTEAVLWVLDGNTRAERFYRRDGWHADGRRQQEEVWGVSVVEVAYRRTL